MWTVTVNLSLIWNKLHSVCIKATIWSVNVLFYSLIFMGTRNKHLWSKQVRPSCKSVVWSKRLVHHKPKYWIGRPNVSGLNSNSTDIQAPGTLMGHLLLLLILNLASSLEDWDMGGFTVREYRETQKLRSAGVSLYKLNHNFRLPDQIKTCLSQDAYRKNQKGGGFVLWQHQHPSYHQPQCDVLLLNPGGPCVLQQ